MESGTKSSVGQVSPNQQANLRYPLGVLPFTSILLLAPQREHPIPQCKGSVLQDCPLSPTSDASCKPRSLVLLAHQLQIRGS